MPSLNHNSKGTTIVEALVVIVVLSFGLIPILLVIILAGSLSSTISNNLIATNLAQEGVEVVRAIRDANWFNSRLFDDGLTPISFDCTTGCRVQWDSTSLLADSGNPVLRINNGLYNYSTGQDTNFRRRIIITKIGTFELKVVSEVTWQQRNATKKVEVEGHLFDWR